MTTRPQRVLVIDDEQVYRESIRDALSEDGIECALAAGEEEAAKAVEDPAIGVAILDVRLPGAVGAELLRRLQGLRPGLRVIALSDATDQEQVLEALRQGACDYLAKPLHEEELRLAVRRALEGHAAVARWQSLRGRLQRLGVRLADLAARAREGDRAALAQPVVELLAESLDVTRTSLLVADYSRSVLRVVASFGNDLDPHEMDPAMIGESVAGLAFEEADVLVIDDIDADERCAGRVRRPRYHTSSVLLAPLCGDRGPFGVLCGTDREGGLPFGEEDLALLRVLALQVGALLAPETPELPTRPPSEALSLAGDDAELARAICEAVTAEVEPERLVDAALRAVERALPASPVSLHLIDGRSGELVVLGQRDGGRVADRERLPRDRGLTGMVLQTGRLVAVDHPETDPRFDPEVDTPDDGAAAALLCVPLRVRDKVMGVARAFPTGDAMASARTGEVLAAALSAVVRNVFLYRSLLDAVDDVARARRESGSGRGA
jgi:DNA-binding response OmpR family regulator